MEEFRKAWHESSNDGVWMYNFHGPGEQKRKF